MSALEDIGKLKVTELRSELQSRGLDTKGVKAVLLDRLRESIEAEEMENDPEKQVNNDEEMPEEGKSVAITKENESLAVEEENESVSAEEEKVSVAVEEKGSVLAEEDKLSVAVEEENESVLAEEEKESVNVEEEKESVNVEEEKESVEEKETEALEEESEKVIKNEDLEKLDAVEETNDKIEKDHVEEAMEDDGNVEENGHETAVGDLSAKEEKVAYEDAPMEDLSAVKEEIKEEESTIEKEGNDTVKTEIDSEVKTENSSSEKRGLKRSNENSHNDNKRPRPDQIEDIRVEDEPEFDKSVVALDWYNSDLSLVLDKETRLNASPIVMGGFAYVWHGVRGLYGTKAGKLFFEVKIEDNLQIVIEDTEMHPHVVRVGWSIDNAHLTLGEGVLSYGYGGTGKASTNLKFKDYGKTFGKGDVLGCFLDMESKPITMSFTVNGENQGICYEINGEDLGEKALFPHILTKNCSFKVNFGKEDPWFEPLTGYSFIDTIAFDDLTMGTQGPEKREDAEIIMMVGLPAAGKSTWAEKHCKENPEKKYNVLGTNNLIDRMKVNGLPRKRNYSGRWDQLIEKCTKCLNKMLYIATKRRRNFILDQTNVYPSAQKRKIKGFAGYKRRAVVVVPTDEELKSRTQKREGEEGKEVPDRAILEMKGNFRLPEVGEFFEEVDFVELDKDESAELLKKYNKEGEHAGFGPKRFSSTQGRRVGYVDRQDNRGGGSSYGSQQRGGSGGGYRGGWDRDRDRRGSFDRRDRGSNSSSSGGGGGSSWNRDRSYRGSSGGGSGGYNKDRRSGSSWNSGNSSWSSGGSGGSGGYKGNQGKSDSWGQGYNQNWNSSGQQSYGSNQGGGYNNSSGNSTGYNWNQQYYGNNQQGQQQQQPQQQYYQQQQQSYGNNTYSSNNQSQQQQPQQQQQWGGNYGQQQQPQQQQWGGSSSGSSYSQNQYRK